MGVKMALTGFGPISVAAVRILMAAVSLTILAYARGIGLPAFSQKRVWAHCAGMGMFSNVIPFILLSWGQLYVASGFAGITMAVVPLFVLPLAHFLVPAERLTPRKAAGFSVGFVGVAILIGPGAWASTGAEAEAWARMACVGAAGGYAIGSIITRLCPKVDQISFSAAALLVASAVIVPIALIVEGWPAMPPVGAIAAVIYLGLFPTALATLLLVRVVQTAGPTFLSIVNYLVPVWSVIFGTILLSEVLPGQFLGALGLILAGLAISQARFIRRRP